LKFIERRAMRLFRRDPLVPALARLSGRGVSASLHWTPPSVRAVWENEVSHEQIVVQVYGVRKWTVCTRGLPPPPAKPRSSNSSSKTKTTTDNSATGEASINRDADLAKREAKCVSAILRRGDVLHVPSWTWHWTGAGPKASCHLELAVTPLNGADLVMGLSVRDRLFERGNPTMAMPLPLWRHSRAVDATDDVIQVCYDLPWTDAPMDSAVFCAFPVVEKALQRLSGVSGRPHPRWNPSHLSEVARPSSRVALGREGIFSSMKDELFQPGKIQVVGLSLMAVLVFICWLFSSPQEKGHLDKRPMRSAATIRLDRSLQKQSRIAMQQAARHTKRS